MASPLKEESVTLRTAIARLVTQMEADGKSPLTIQVYKAELLRFAKSVGSQTQVRTFLPDKLARYLTEDATRLTPEGTPRSARTLNRTKATLRLLFRYLHDTGAIQRDPTRVLRNARTDRKEPLVLTSEETTRLLAALKERATDSLGRRDRVLFTLLLRSGMRLGAALALDVADVDLAANCAISQGKHSKVQKVYFPKDVATLLKRHLKDKDIAAAAVFRGNRGRLSVRQAQYRFRQVLATAEIERTLTVHSLRHTFATRLREETGDLRLVQVALGHRQLATTQVYAKVDTAVVASAVLALK